MTCTVYRISGKIENAIWKYPHCSGDIYKSLKIMLLKYAKEITDDVIYSTQHEIKYIIINRAISVKLQQRSLKLGRVIVIQAAHLWL